MQSGAQRLPVQGTLCGVQHEVGLRLVLQMLTGPLMPRWRLCLTLAQSLCVTPLSSQLVLSYQIEGMTPCQRGA